MHHHQSPAAPPPPQRSKLVVLDSRDRDLTLFPDPNAYEVSLPEPIYDISKIELTAAEVPMSASYTVEPVNAAFRLLTYGTRRTNARVALQIGDYDSKASLATEVQRALNDAAGVANAFSVLYSPRLDGFDIRAKEAYVLIFDDSAALAAHKLLGHRRAVDVASAPGGPDPTYPHSRFSAFRCDMGSAAPQYLALHLTVDGDVSVDALTIAASEPPRNPAAVGAFAVISRSDVGMNVLSLGPTRASKALDPPLPRLTRFRVRLLDAGTGKGYDAKNRDHRLELRVEHNPAQRMRR